MNTPTHDYLDLPYHIEIVRSESPEDDDGGWVAEVRELKGCIAQGRTPDELMANIRGAMGAWIDDALSVGDRIPQPRPEVTQSGKLLVRMPRSLHSTLAATAEREGVSLNQLVVSLLSGAISEARNASPFAG